MVAFFLVAGAYAAGSVPFSYLVVKGLTGTDVRTGGSGNVGATNVFRTTGPAAAGLALALDIGKGAVPVLLALRLAPSPPMIAAAGVAAVLGHVFPIFLQFRGGKGGATGFGVLLALAPLAAGLTVLILVVVVGWKRYVSLGTMVAAASTPGVILLVQRFGETRVEGAWLPGMMVAIAVVVVGAHHANIARLRAGTEPTIGDRPG